MTKKKSQWRLRFLPLCLLPILFLEAALRLLTSYPRPVMAEYHERLGTRMKPNGHWRYESPENRAVEVRSNSWGFRDDEWRPNRRFRVAVLGDSFVEAIQVRHAQTFHALMERELGWDCYAIGVSGWSQANQLAAMRWLCPQVGPFDLYLVVAFPPNDLRDNVVGLRTGENRGWRRWLYEHAGAIGQGIYLTAHRIHYLLIGRAKERRNPPPPLDPEPTTRLLREMRAVVPFVLAIIDDAGSQTMAVCADAAGIDWFLLRADRLLNGRGHWSVRGHEEVGRQIIERTN